MIHYIKQIKHFPFFVLSVSLWFTIICQQFKKEALD